MYISEADAYPMPRIDELIDRLGGAKFITTLDLTRGYWQVPVAPASRALTAFTTPFDFTVMPFGLHGAPATFQRMMHHCMDVLLNGIEEYAAAYLDHLVVFSSSWSEHLQHLRSVLQRLQEAELTVKPSKCQIGMRHCIYLGYRVGDSEIQPEIKKEESFVAALRFLCRAIFVLA